VSVGAEGVGAGTDRDRAPDFDLNAANKAERKLTAETANARD
jgi:hypothetical protein